MRLRCLRYAIRCPQCGAVGVIERTGVDSKAFFDIWRAKQLEYSWLRAVTGHHVDFWQVTRDALDYALESFGIAGSTLGSAMMDAYLRLPIFPDVLPTLEQLRASGLRRAILSNGTAHMLSCNRGTRGSHRAL